MFWLAICACVQCWVLDLWTIFVLALLPLTGNLIFSILLLYSLKTVSSKFISVCRMKEILYQFNFKISITSTRSRIQCQNTFFLQRKRQLFTYWHGWMCFSFILFTALFVVIIVDMVMGFYVIGSHFTYFFSGISFGSHDNMFIFYDCQPLPWPSADPHQVIFHLITFKCSA